MRDYLKSRFFVAIFQPDNVNAPPLGALLHEIEGLGHFAPGVLEADNNTIRQVAIRFEYLVQHVGAGAPAAK